MGELLNFRTREQQKLALALEEVRVESLSFLDSLQERHTFDRSDAAILVTFMILDEAKFFAVERDDSDAKGVLDFVRAAFFDGSVDDYTHTSANREVCNV